MRRKSSFGFLPCRSPGEWCRIPASLPLACFAVNRPLWISAPTHPPAVTPNPVRSPNSRLSSIRLSSRSTSACFLFLPYTVSHPKVTGGYTVNDTGCFAKSPINNVKYTGDTVHLPLRVYTLCGRRPARPEPRSPLPDPSAYLRLTTPISTRKRKVNNAVCAPAPRMSSVASPPCAPRFPLRASRLPPSDQIGPNRTTFFTPLAHASTNLGR
jgi:hypothetical protein